MKACKVLTLMAAIVLTVAYAPAAAQELGCPPGQEAVYVQSGQKLQLSGDYAVGDQDPSSGKTLLCRLPAYERSSNSASSAGIVALTIGLGALGLALFAVGFTAFVRQARRRPDNFVIPPTHT
jgi:hypothetical protein